MIGVACLRIVYGLLDVFVVSCLFIVVCCQLIVVCCLWHDDFVCRFYSGEGRVLFVYCVLFVAYIVLSILRWSLFVGCRLTLLVFGCFMFVFVSCCLSLVVRCPLFVGGLVTGLFQLLPLFGVRYMLCVVRSVLFAVSCLLCVVFGVIVFLCACLLCVV